MKKILVAIFFLFGSNSFSSERLELNREELGLHLSCLFENFRYENLEDNLGIQKNSSDLVLNSKSPEKPLNKIYKEMIEYSCIHSVSPFSDRLLALDIHDLLAKNGITFHKINTEQIGPIEISEFETLEQIVSDLIEYRKQLTST